mgnify:CR=1 FL=1
MEEYIAAKENIFTHQGADGLLVLNQDNGITRGFAVSARGRVTRFSRREELEQEIQRQERAVSDLEEQQQQMQKDLTQAEMAQSALDGQREQMEHTLCRELTIHLQECTLEKLPQ